MTVVMTLNNSVTHTRGHSINSTQITTVSQQNSDNILIVRLKETNKGAESSHYKISKFADLQNYTTSTWTNNIDLANWGWECCNVSAPSGLRRTFFVHLKTLTDSSMYSAIDWFRCLKARLVRTAAIQDAQSAKLCSVRRTNIITSSRVIIYYS